MFSFQLLWAFMFIIIATASSVGLKHAAADRISFAMHNIAIDNICLLGLK